MTDLEMQLTGSIEIVKRDKVIALQKEVIANQAEEIKLLNERLNILEMKLLRVADSARLPALKGGDDTPALLKRQAS